MESNLRKTDYLRESRFAKNERRKLIRNTLNFNVITRELCDCSLDASKILIHFDLPSLLCDARREIGKHVECLLRRFQTLFKSVPTMRAF